MVFDQVFRVVALRKGKMRAVEFRLREDEVGLSLFAQTNSPRPLEVIEAVRAAGKQGDLRAALFQREQVESLGLRLVRTPGGTSNAEVNAIHFEVRLPFWRRVYNLLRGVAVHDYFNQTFSQRLSALARLAEEERR